MTEIPSLDPQEPSPDDINAAALEKELQFAENEGDNPLIVIPVEGGIDDSADAESQDPESPADPRLLSDEKKQRLEHYIKHGAKDMDEGDHDRFMGQKYGRDGHRNPDGFQRLDLWAQHLLDEDQAAREATNPADPETDNHDHHDHEEDDDQSHEPSFIDDHVERTGRATRVSTKDLLAFQASIGKTVPDINALLQLRAQVLDGIKVQPLSEREEKTYQRSGISVSKIQRAGEQALGTMERYSRGEEWLLSSSERARLTRITNAVRLSNMSKAQRKTYKEGHGVYPEDAEPGVLSPSEQRRIRKEWVDNGGSVVTPDQSVLIAAQVNAKSRLQLDDELRALQLQSQRAARPPKAERILSVSEEAGKNARRSERSELYSYLLADERARLQPEFERLAEAMSRTSNYDDRRLQKLSDTFELQAVKNAKQNMGLFLRPNQPVGRAVQAYHAARVASYEPEAAASTPTTDGGNNRSRKLGRFLVRRAS